MILVMRCSNPDTYRPADTMIVQCHHCGEDCWLTTAYGNDVTAIGRFFGDPRYICNECYDWEIGL